MLLLRYEGFMDKIDESIIVYLHGKNAVSLESGATDNETNDFILDKHKNAGLVRLRDEARLLNDEPRFWTHGTYGSCNRFYLTDLGIQTAENMAANAPEVVAEKERVAREEKNIHLADEANRIAEEANREARSANLEARRAHRTAKRAVYISVFAVAIPSLIALWPIVWPILSSH
jgi:hypothetical protein